MCRIASRCQKAGRAGWQKTDVWQSFASFGFEAQLLLDETVCLINIRRYRVGSDDTHSAAVCELSDACDTEFERGFG